jgi:hypothetical protein
LTPAQLITNSNEEIWIEAKYWLIGNQKKRHYNAQFYLNDKAQGIIKDVKKLCRVSNGGKFLLILAVINPIVKDEEDWQNGINSFNKKFSPFYLTNLTNPIDFPECFHIGLIEVTNE